MQTTPTPVPKSVMKRGTTTMQKSSLHKASPMDAAPYTPLSARRGVSAQVSDTTAKFVGKLSFTPHVRHQRQHSLSPTSKRSPVASPDQQSATGNKPCARPPVVSMYAPCRGSNASDQSGTAQQSSKAGIQHNFCPALNCYLMTSKHALFTHAFLSTGSTASGCLGPSATAARPSLTPARPSSPFTVTPKRAALPQQDATHFQSRFAIQSAQQSLQTTHSMSAVSDPAGISAADAFLQPTPASGVASLQHSSLPPSRSLLGRLSDMQPSSSRVTSNTTSSGQQAQAALDANQTSPEKLQLPFGLSPTALSAELPQEALPSGHQNARVPQPGTMSLATCLSGSVLSSAQSKRGLSLQDRLDSQRSGVSGQRSTLHWEPVQTSVDSPEKQELGRRECLHVILAFLQTVSWASVSVLHCLVTEACFAAQVCTSPFPAHVCTEVCMLSHVHAFAWSASVSQLCTMHNSLS